ncbi:acyl carrier protein [Maribacter polysiphoniae]|uniref:Acyl carrier protein n=1 Tax=Maribacter polysiphoniae TaxID=429344 RepID=A0A316DV63_9FLAO|nr:phosphopantetheine-binding protein [Maribacter polysiphoniae]MBD1262697.1 acyl carrier protein [Maribacter polysiphoniae]PWK21099.1 acyl carrier protein [Maribacter polysiphoniae]
MENFIESIAEILEEETVELSDELESFEAWDSLTILSIIAICDAEYGVALSAGEIEGSGTILELKELIESKM